MLAAMRILTVGNMYPPHHVGGYELTWRSSVEDLRGAGHAVRVLTTDHVEEAPDPAIGEDPDVHRELRWYWHDDEIPGLSIRERVALERHNLEVIDRHLAELRPDIVVWWAMWGMSLSLLAHVLRRGLPAVGMVGDDWMTYAGRIDGWERAFGRPVVGRLAEAATGIETGVDLAAAARWIFISTYLRERAVAAGIAIADAQVIHPGIDPAAFGEAPQRDWTGRLLCLGRIDRRKGIETAVRALPLLPGCTLRCVGASDAAHLAELEGLAGRLQVDDRVSFEGRLRHDRVAGAYADADALLCPATWPEPFGLVPLEAMSVGTPVIATGTGGSAEYLRDDRDCLLFPPGNEEMLGGAVRHLAADPDLRARLRTGGLQTAARHTEERYNSAFRAAIEAAAAR
jgi:glycogen synthase